MSVITRHPMKAAMFLGNSGLTVMHLAFSVAGADNLGAAAAHATLAAGAGVLLARRRLPSTERKALQDQKRRNRRAGGYEAAEVQVRADLKTDQIEAKIETLGDRLIELTGGIEDAKERAALAEIMYGPHSTWGQAQATIEHIDDELRAMENAEWERRKADAEKAEAERLAAMSPEEREWAAFGGPPRRLSPEELAEVRERVRPVGESPVGKELTEFAPKPMEIRSRYIASDDVWVPDVDMDQVDLMTWGQEEAIKTLYGVPEPSIGSWTVDDLVEAVRSGKLPELDAYRILDEQRRRAEEKAYSRCKGVERYTRPEANRIAANICGVAYSHNDHWHVARRR